MNPKRKIQHVRGNIGSSSFELFVNRELGWIFRPVHLEHDFGIDGYIDIVDDGQVTGTSIAVQIKCGTSYIAKTTTGGLRYDGEIKHLNYYSNLRQPVLLVVLDENGENGMWGIFSIESTMPSDSAEKWWMEIPRSNQLDSSVADTWRAIAGPAIDFTNQFKDEWESYRMHSMATNLVVGIEKPYVLACDTKSLFLWQSKLLKTRELMLSKCGSIDFWFRGWLEDPRALSEIPEIRAYFQQTLEKGFPWIYWLQTDFSWVGYQLLFACTCCELKTTHLHNGKCRAYVKDTNAFKHWIDFNFHNLNLFTEAHDIPLDINEQCSDNLLLFIKTNLQGSNSFNQ